MFWQIDTAVAAKSVLAFFQAFGQVIIVATHSRGHIIVFKMF